VKAVIQDTYGPPEVLKIAQVEKPVPGDDEVLVKVRASSVNPAEWYAVTGLFVARLAGGLFRPKNQRLGVDYAGTVEVSGKNMPQFKPGDAVFGARSGAFAEYVVARKIVLPMPAGLPFEEAGGMATAAITALQGLRDHGRLQAGQSVLINGASGGVGTYAIQIAKALGAEVTGVCSPGNLAQASTLGADHVIDYTQEDFTHSGRRYDLVLDIAGSRPWGAVKRILHPKSTVVIVGGPKSNRIIGPLGHVIRTQLGAIGAGPKIVFFIATFERADFLLLKDMIESGRLCTVVDRVYPLERVSEAMNLLGEGHARGKIILTMG
jgi:NADPH:quinone reductase-like Zn-dependent oxidoreductase